MNLKKQKYNILKGDAFCSYKGNNSEMEIFAFLLTWATSKEIIGSKFFPLRAVFMFEKFHYTFIYKEGNFLSAESVSLYKMVAELFSLKVEPSLNP